VHDKYNAKVGAEGQDDNPANKRQQQQLSGTKGFQD